jgi:hypothetical protein
MTLLDVLFGQQRLFSKGMTTGHWFRRIVGYNAGGSHDGSDGLIQQELLNYDDENNGYIGLKNRSRGVGLCCVLLCSV